LENAPKEKTTRIPNTKWGAGGDRIEGLNYLTIFCNIAAEEKN